MLLVLSSYSDENQLFEAPFAPDPFACHSLSGRLAPYSVSASSLSILVPSSPQIVLVPSSPQIVLRLLANRLTTLLIPLQSKKSQDLVMDPLHPSNLKRNRRE
ncbi:hypothetical protein Tco_1066325 [Tanacetum coccineum]|uniref:Uncharacterized protein n=1 Tax=Tanacetum coccineum TaxID=301880 RepID=A0ABQ5HBS6_9ASTR